MSAISNSSKSINTLFCKFCFDAGRGDFDTHNTRDRNGKLTCKFLAGISCTRCGENGHTLKYCRAKISLNSTDNVDVNGWKSVSNSRRTKKPTNSSSNSNTPSINNRGTFSALVVEDEYSDDIQNQCVGIVTSKKENLPLESSHLIGDDGYKVTITWASKSNVFTDKVNNYSSEPPKKKSWADMVEEDDGSLPPLPSSYLSTLVDVV